jgi:hypothetical protein
VSVVIPFSELNWTDEFKGEAAQRKLLCEHRRDLLNSFGSFNSEPWMLRAPYPYTAALPLLLSKDVIARFFLKNRGNLMMWSAKVLRSPRRLTAPRDDEST